MPDHVAEPLATPLAIPMVRLPSGKAFKVKPITPCCLAAGTHLIAERYERRSLGITSNMVFSEWERIFANPMATAAAIDRVVITPSSWSSMSQATGPTPPNNVARLRR